MKEANSENVFCKNCNHDVSYHLVGKGCFETGCKCRYHPVQICFENITALRTTLAERETDLDKLVRYLINSGLVKVDDMSNSDAIQEAIIVMDGMQYVIAEREKRIVELEAGIRKIVDEVSSNSGVRNEYQDFDDVYVIFENLFPTTLKASE